MSLPALFGDHFQIAYVVRDTQAAIDVFTRRFGVKQWHVMDMVAVHGEQSAIRAISLAWSGDVMIELIEPVPGKASIYTDYTPATQDGIRLHHFGFLIPTMEEFEETVRLLDAAGFPTAAAGQFGDQLHFHYADTTPALGHYYELIHLPPAGANFFAAVPKN
ncbi:MAG: VOC family protein [Sphingomonadaceae bacterium]|nr:VOC family protein [Sphingomonadaceae bacterium]